MDSLKNENVLRLFLRMTIPSFVIVFVSGSYNIVDGIFLGRALGTTGSAANSYVFLIYATIHSVSALIAQGTSSLLTLELGKQKNKSAKQIFSVSITISVIIAIVQSGLIYAFFPKILNLLGVNPEYYKYLTDYFNLFLLGTPIYFLSHTFIYCMRAEGHIRQVLKINLISFLANCFFSALFIEVLELGFLGSALSTIIANFLMMFYGWKHFKTDVLKIHFKDLTFDRNIFFNIISTGLPVFMTRFLSVLLLLLYNYLGNFYAGEYGIATLSIGTTLYRYITTMMDAITNGAQPIIGYNFGAKKYIRVRQALSYSLITSTVFSIIVFIVIFFMSDYIVSLFVADDSEFISFASSALKLILLLAPLQGINSVGTYYFQYIGNKKKSIFLVAFRQILLQVPLSVVLSNYIGIDGLWYSFCLSDLILFILILSFLLNEYKRMANNSIKQGELS